MTTQVSNKVLTLPNLITLVRLLLVPFFVASLLVYQNNVAAFLLFFVAAATDFLDGTVARATGQVSRLGQQLDPLVDRVLILTAVVTVFALGRVPLWVLLLLIARDLCLLVLVALQRSAGQREFRVAFIGKAATACNMLGFCLLILNWPLVGGLGLVDAAFLPGWGSESVLLGTWFLYLGVLLAWCAGGYYLLRAYREASGALPHPEAQATYDARSASSDSEYTEHGAGHAAGHGSHAHAAHAAGHGSHAHAVAPVARRGSAGHARNDHAPNRHYAHRQTETRRVPRTPSAPTGASSKLLILRLLNTPQKLLSALAVSLVLLGALAFYGIDTASNYGVIHAGVRVGTLDTSKLTLEEAAQLLSEDLTAVASSNPVYLYASNDALASGPASTTLHLENGVSTYSSQEANLSSTSWSVGLSTLGAEVNGAQLASEAYGVGRGGDFLLGRIAANLAGVHIAPHASYPADKLRALEEMLTAALGTPVLNAGISFNGSSFVVEDGRDGYVVDSRRFESLLQQAFFSEERGFVVPLVEQRRPIDEAAAAQVAQTAQKAIAEPVTISYQNNSWQITSAILGQLITAQAEQSEQGTWQLVPRVDAAALALRVPAIVGIVEEQIAPLNASFAEVDGKLTIIPSQNGAGLDYKRLANDLTLLLFSPEEAAAARAQSPDAATTTDERTISMHIGVLEPALRTSDAQALKLPDKIGSFTIEYPYVEQGTITNIHVASDSLNGSLIAPGDIWSFNETAGECTPEKGFVEAGIILGDEYTDSIGGGVCNVASTIFNAVWESGLPVVERVNHSLRITRYPLGRDAAIAFPYADFKFQNDTENWVVLTMSYTDYTVTCTLWGVMPGYRVVSEASELEEFGEYQEREVENPKLPPGEKALKQSGKKASSIHVVRTVYAADGSLKEQRTFWSNYDSTPEITEVGPARNNEEASP